MDEAIRDPLQAQTGAKGLVVELKQHSEQSGEGGPCGNDDGDDKCLGYLHRE